MQYFSPDQESPAASATRIARELVSGIGDYLAADQPPGEDAVHEIRKTCKRLRALLRLLRPAIGEDAFTENERRTRKLAIRLGQARDQAVMTTTLQGLVQHYAPLLATDAFRPVLDALAHQATVSASACQPRTLHGLFHELQRSINQLELATVGIDTLVAGIAASYRRGYHMLRIARQQPDDEPVHALRRHTKHLYYQLAMIEELDVAACTPLVALSHRVEEALGQVHDLSVLTHAVRNDLLRDDPLRREVLLSLLETRWVRQLGAALRDAELLFDRKPGRFRDWLAGRLSGA